MSREFEAMVTDNDEQERWLSSVLVDLALGPVVAAGLAGALAWYRGATPTGWQQAALGAIGVIIVAVRLYRRRLARHRRLNASR